MYVASSTGPQKKSYLVKSDHLGDTRIAITDPAIKLSNTHFDDIERTHSVVEIRRRQSFRNGNVTRTVSKN